jgi:radical SAM superfamily enzyme YgiQ (UPF0313 family)
MSARRGRPVLLVNPRICSPKNARLPLSLLALGAVLEGKREYALVDGNLDPDAAGTVLAHLDRAPHSLVGLTVMPGPQVGPAIAISEAVRDRFPGVPIAWGGYFPSLYPEAAVNAPYVDAVVRGAGEETLLELLARVGDGGASAGRGPLDLSGVPGVSWKRDGAIVHEADRPWREPDRFPPLPIDSLGDVSPYLARTFLGRRTGVHQAAIGCRYRCSFCGVVSMFGGKTLLSGPARMLAAVETLRDRHGADAIQFYDNNFFDSEESSIPVLEALSRAGLPYWCYARPDTLAGFSSRTWELARRSGLRMAYVGAEAGSDRALRAMHKGTKVEQTFEVARRSREYGVIPEFSFVLGGPEDPEGEVENTLRFVRKLKAIHPECEVILYFYTPTPQRDPERTRRDGPGVRAFRTAYGAQEVDLPTTPEEWTEKRWVDFVCHQDAPWLTPKLRRRIHDFATVLACRFPTVQDARLPSWGKATLRSLASWRWAARAYGSPLELEVARRAIRLKDPQSEGL